MKRLAELPRALVCLAPMATLMAGCAIGPGADDPTAIDGLAGARRATFQDGVAPTADYAATHEATLAQGAATTNAGADPSCHVDGDHGNGNDLACLLYWNVTSIPAGSTVRSVTIDVNVTNPTNSGYGIYEEKRSWIEPEATWNTYRAGSDWQTAGSLGSDDRGTLVLGTMAPRATGHYALALGSGAVALVQRWVDDTASNHGVILADRNATDGMAFDSSEAATATDRPKLIVTFDPPGTDAGVDAATDAHRDAATDARTDAAVDAHPDAAVDAGPAVSSILVPRTGAWWGAMTNPRSGESQASAFTRFETDQQRTLDIVHAYHSGTQTFPNATEQDWAAHGRILLINWKPSTTSWGDVANGSLDESVVIPAADRIKAFARPMFLVLWHEPEDQLDAHFDTAANYVAMWRHVHQVFEARGVHNVVWVWNMMGYVSHAASWTSLYPGDAYVDWLGADPYTFASQTFDQSTASFYTWATTSHPGKPIMYCEYGPGNSNDSFTPDHEASWIRSVLASLRTTRPAVRAVVYWENTSPQWSTQDGIDGSSTYLDAFRSVAHDPFLNQPHS